MSIKISGENGVVCRVPGSAFGYFGWPSVARMDDGTLAVAASGPRHAHICPWGKDSVAFSRDNGRTWDEPFPVSPSAPDVDHGYPSTVQLPDGTFLTAYYEAAEAGGKPCVKLSRWQEG